MVHITKTIKQSKDIKKPIRQKSPSMWYEYICIICRNPLSAVTTCLYWSIGSLLCVPTQMAKDIKYGSIFYAPPLLTIIPNEREDCRMGPDGIAKIHYRKSLPPPGGCHSVKALHYSFNNRHFDNLCSESWMTAGGRRDGCTSNYTHLTKHARVWSAAKVFPTIKLGSG